MHFTPMMGIVLPHRRSSSSVLTRTVLFLNTRHPPSVTTCARHWEKQQEEATMTVLREAIIRENVENWIGIILAFGGITLGLALPAFINHIVPYPLLLH
jgi:hypothetical protein